MKRTALADAKTGMPVFHPAQQAAAAAAAAQLYPGSLTAHQLALAAAVGGAGQQLPPQLINYPPGAQAAAALNFPVQYAQYISLPCMLCLILDHSIYFK